MCMRAVRDGLPTTGWRTIKTTKDRVGLILRREDSLASSLPPRREKREAEPPKVSPAVWAKRVAAYQMHMGDQRAALASILGVEESALAALHCGWRPERGDWTFPARDGEGAVVGVSTRLAVPIVGSDGKTTSKMMIKGSSPGLFYAPEAWAAGDGPILLVEGASDTAAAYSMGLAAVGRPSNTGGIVHLARLLRDLPAGRPIVVVGENDDRDGISPGRNGAILTATRLAEEIGRPVMWSMPPAEAKDTRDFLRANGREAGPRFVELILAGATTIEPPPLGDDVERLPDRGPARSIEEMRREIAAGIGEALRGPPAIHLFKPGTGTGKTTLALEAAALSRAEAAGRDERKEKGEARFPEDFTISIPTHANVREVERSASRLGLAPAAYPERNEDNCGNIEKAAKAAGMGLNVFAAVCESCPVAARCKESGYLAWVKEANASACKIGTHSRAVVASKMTETAEAIIIDEDPAQALAPTHAADAADVLAVMHWAENVRDDLGLDGRSIEAAIDDQIFAASLADAAKRIMLAVEGLKEVDVDLTAEQEEAAKAEKAAALHWKKRDHEWAARRLAEAKFEAKRLREKAEKVDQPGAEKRLVDEAKAEAEQAEAKQKQRSKQARAAKAAMKRAEKRPLTSFAAGRPATALATYPAGRVIRLDLPAEVQAPDNWSELVFRWAERYGAGRAISPEARKIVMLAATGGLEALYVVEAAPRDNQTTGGHYVFAKGKTAIPRDRPIIALDATADADALRAMTGREVIDHTPAGHVALVHDAIQFTTDLTESTTPAAAANVVEAILERFPEKRRIGVIGWQKTLAGLDEELGPASRERIAKTAYFWQGPDRGSNTWITPVEDGGDGCDLLIVLGTPRPGAEPVRQMLLAMGQIEAASLLDGDWGPRRWEGRRPDGRPVIVEAAGYRHPEWHRAFGLIVRSMLRQAIGRARASLPEGIPVVAVTVEPTGLPVADPLPILGAEVRQTVDLARSLAKRNPIYKESIGRVALRGWLRTADLAAALAEPDAVRKQNSHATPRLSKRACQIRIERAVAAGRLVRGPRGWIGIAGDCDPWPASGAAPIPEPAAQPAEAPTPATRPPVAPAARPAASRPEIPAASFEIRAAVAALRAEQPTKTTSIYPPAPTHEEQTWSRMALAKTG